MGPMVTVNIDKIRLIEKFRPPKHRNAVAYMVD